MDFVRTICQAQGAYDGVPERVGVRVVRGHNTVRSCSPQTKEKEHEEEKPKAPEAALLKFSAQEDSRWLPRGAENSGPCQVGSFGGRIRVVHCFYGPCKSGDMVAVQR